MASESLPYDVALARLRTARPIVSPNPGFVKQLKEFERSGRAASSLLPGAEEAWEAAGVNVMQIPLVRSLSEGAVGIVGSHGCRGAGNIALRSFSDLEPETPPS